jgi:hypothetical protein
VLFIAYSRRTAYLPRVVFHPQPILDSYNTISQLPVDLTQAAGAATYGSVALSLVNEAFRVLYVVVAQDSDGQGGAGEEEEDVNGQGGAGKEQENGNENENEEKEKEEEIKGPGWAFRKAPQSRVKIPPFTTPPREQPRRIRTLETLSSALADHPNIKNLTVPLYEPFEVQDDMDADTRRLLVHGTRFSSLPELISYGI